jgi:CheY-like chemotaxis protein
LTVPAVAITAVYLRPEDREKILAAGFDAYLRKPVLPAELTATLLRARHGAD